MPNDDRNIIRQRRGAEEVSIEETTQTIANVPTAQSFPMFLFTCAVFKDILDIADLTLIGIIFSSIFGFFLYVWIFFWMFGKGGYIKKRIYKRLLIPIIVMPIVEFIPFLKILSSSSLLIVMIYRSERNIVKEMKDRLYFTIQKAHNDNEMEIYGKELKNITRRKR